MKIGRANKPAGLSGNSRFTIFGLAIVVIGWCILLAGLAVSDATLQSGSLVATMSIRSDLITIAQSAVVSGLGLAIIGALRSGFGAFGRFFDAVLQRSATPRPPVASEPQAPSVAVSAYDRASPVYERATPPTPPPRSKDRNYVVLPDGSVEVETMFGTRIFATLDEAREFIR